MCAVAIVERREWVVTDEGRRASEEVPTCDDCDSLFVVNGCFMCCTCGTVYGLVWGFNRFPRRNRRRVG